MLTYEEAAHYVEDNKLHVMCWKTNNIYRWSPGDIMKNGELYSKKFGHLPDQLKPMGVGFKSFPTWLEAVQAYKDTHEYN